MPCITVHKRSNKWVGRSATASKDVVFDGTKGIRIASYNVLKIGKEGPSCHHSLGTSDSDQSMDHHCVVQVQEKC